MQFLAFRMGEVKDDCSRLQTELASSKVSAVVQQHHSLAEQPLADGYKSPLLQLSLDSFYRCL